MWQKNETVLDVILTEKSLYDYLEKLNHSVLVKNLRLCLFFSPYDFSK